MHQKQCNPFLCEHYIYRYIKGELHFIRLLARPLVGAQGRRGLSTAARGRAGAPRPAAAAVRPRRGPQAFYADTYTQRHTGDTARYSTQHSLSSSSLHLQPQCRPLSRRLFKTVSCMHGAWVGTHPLPDYFYTRPNHGHFPGLEGSISFVHILLQHRASISESELQQSSLCRGRMGTRSTSSLPPCQPGRPRRP